MKVNLGCGRRIIPDYVNVDIRDGEGVDKVFDATKEWPFPIASVEKIRAYNVFEHLHEWEKAFMESARVLKPGGLFEIVVPYGWRGTAWPFHVRAFVSNTFDLFMEPFQYRGIDLRLHTGEIGTCERELHGYFIKVKVNKHHLFPFSWHLAKRLGEWIYRLPLAKTHELYFLFERNNVIWGDSNG